MAGLRGIQRGNFPDPRIRRNWNRLATLFKQLLGGGLTLDEDGNVIVDPSGIDHGQLAGLGDDDHTQYVLRSILTTKGDIFVRNSTVIQRLAVGNDDEVLTADSGETSGLKWAAPVIPPSGGRLLSMQVFDTAGSTTWTKPADCNFIVIELVGAGGGGGGVTASAFQGAAGGGGGAGGYGIVMLDSPPSSETIVIGAGGTGGSTSAGDGATGGNTEWGALGGTYYAEGGAGGKGMSGGTGVALAAGGAGGRAVDCDIDGIGGPGLAAFRVSAALALCGAGGSVRYGGGPRARTNNGDGLAGTAYGAGGAGAQSLGGSNQAGGDGADGLIVVWEYS